MTTRLEHRTIMGEKIKLENGPAYHALGPDLALEDCDLAFEGSSSSATIAGLTMTGGSFGSGRPSTNIRFDRAHFEGVRFFGRYVGCDFGDRDETSRCVSNCDFSTAWLHLCRFKDGDAETCRFGPWPTVVILNPQENAPKLLERVPSSWDAWRMLVAILAKSPPEWGATALNVRQSMQKYGGNEEELKSVFAQTFVLTPAPA
ncbi:MAG TPA: hypothetical protein VG939_00480 [Caulobacteraceae bacterium]|nr:hypothetical protein [Caulobacteraceae bacterium]